MAMKSLMAWQRLFFLAIASLVAPTFGYSQELERVFTIHNRGAVRGENLHDTSIYSPKSAIFHPDGQKFYVNSLEGFNTTVYSWPDLTKLETVEHSFDGESSHLFKGSESTIFGLKYNSRIPADGPNVFQGKPVEFSFSHGGRFLWISYYRRSFDRHAVSPSAIAIVDTNLDKIVRVMPTGPLPKMLATSPDGQFLVVTHWGNNTLGVIDIRSDDPMQFRYIRELTVGKSLNLKFLRGTDRDSVCGFCLRGTTFSPDSSLLFVARMSKSGPGVSVFSVKDWSHRAWLRGFPSTPRHIRVNTSQSMLYVSSNAAGYISRISLKTIDDLIRKPISKGVSISKLIEKIWVGAGARTFDFSVEGDLLFTTVNNSARVKAVDISKDRMKVVAETKVHSFPVGLAVGPGNYIVTTSQGKRGRFGGNAVDIIKWTLPSPAKKVAN